MRKRNARTKTPEAPNRGCWGIADRWGAGVWHIDTEQWTLYGLANRPSGRQCHVFLQRGYYTEEGLTEPGRLSTGQTYKIPRLMTAKNGECTHTMQILLSRGIAGSTKGQEGQPSVGLIWLTSTVDFHRPAKARSGSHGTELFRTAVTISLRPIELTTRDLLRDGPRLLLVVGISYQHPGRGRSCQSSRRGRDTC
jgi:hypothetical protein